MRYAREIEERIIAADKLLSEAQSMAGEQARWVNPLVRIRENLSAYRARVAGTQGAGR